MFPSRTDPATINSDEIGDFHDPYGATFMPTPLFFPQSHARDGLKQSRRGGMVTHRRVRVHARSRDGHRDTLRGIPTGRSRPTRSPTVPLVFVSAGAKGGMMD